MAPLWPTCLIRKWARVYPPCDGGEEGKRQNYKMRSILYETACLLCNPSNNKNENKKERVGVYVGESSRSLHERMSEHEDDARAFREGSNIVKHWMESHPSLDRFPPFRYRIKRTFKDCLSRQVNEAVVGGRRLLYYFTSNFFLFHI